ncbi:unnamed protein product [Dibothriocephalus latus]|uniref:EGF-like domain-containing protein n=1 Tax=Dibothriocephalus latus TaxID=60516 RepID=A0A3P7LHJ3_DIBLA|nr:unnamed protein product [Dibothriocephalus latus]
MEVEYEVPGGSEGIDSNAADPMAVLTESGAEDGDCRKHGCRHEGICRPNRDGQYSCLCHIGYSGLDCQNLMGMTLDSFIGCLDEIYLNGKLLDPRREKFVGDAVDGYGVQLTPKIPEFYGNSHLAFWGIKATSMTDTLFQIVFLPRGSTGLLAYSGYSFDRRGDFFMVALVDGKVLVSFDLGTGPAFLR